MQEPFIATDFIKTFDTNYSGASITPTTPYSILLNGIPLGNSDGNRIGRKVSLNSFIAHLSCTVDVVGPTTTAAIVVPGAFFRFLVVYDRQSNGASYTTANFLNSNRVTALYNTSNRNRFQILFDEFLSPQHSFRYNNTNGTGYNRDISVQYFKIECNLHNISTIFNSSSSLNSITPIQTGSLYLWVLSDGQTTAAPITDVYIEGDGRLFYSDS